MVRKPSGLVIQVLLWAILAAGLVNIGPEAAAEAKLDRVPPEEYAIYDLVVRSKFLTSDTTLVVIERLTVARLATDERPYLSRESLDEEQIFQGQVPPALLDDFLVKLHAPSRLEGRFHFNVRYQFMSNGELEEPEVSLAPLLAAQRRHTQAARPAIGVLRLSRVGFTPREDQALVYVEEDRPDGSGGGFLVWLHRHGKVWTITDTEVLWIARPDE